MAVERFQAPTGGIAIDTAASAVNKTQARELENVLVHNVGKIPLRGPLGHSTLFTGLVDTPVGYWRYGDYVLVDFFGARRRLRIGAPGSSGIDQVSTVTMADTPIQTRSARVGSFAYACRAEDVSNTSQIMKWDGSTSAPTAVGGDGPQKATDLVSHLERLFVAGGIKPGTSGNPATYSTIAVYWTDAGGPTSIVDSWKDDVSGLVNQIDIGAAGDAIVGIASLQSNLVVFKEDSIYTVRGDAPSSFVVRRAADSIGCASANAIITVDNACYFLSKDGTLMHFDGTEFRDFGRPPGLTKSSSTSFPYRASSIAPLPNQYLLVSDSASVWLFHRPSGVWTTLTVTANVLLAYRQVMFNEVGESAISDIDPNGVLSVGVRYGGFLSGLGRSVLPSKGRESIRTSSTTYELVAGRWRTRTSRLAVPFAKAVASRVTVEHNTQSSGVGTALPRWRLEIQDRSGNALSTVDVPANPTNSAVEYARTTAECRGIEADAVSIKVTYQSDAAPADSTAELHDIWLEYESAQKQSRT